MIVYEAARVEFTDDVFSNAIKARILDPFQQRLGHSTGRSEVESWKNSMVYMNNALMGAGIPANAGAAIEYRIPQTAKRVDFILTHHPVHRRQRPGLRRIPGWLLTGQHTMPPGIPVNGCAVADDFARALGDPAEARLAAALAPAGCDLRRDAMSPVGPTLLVLMPSRNRLPR